MTKCALMTVQGGDYMAQFGDKLKSLRIEKGLTQEELAEILGTSKQVISRYENNQRSPKIDVVQKFAKTLDVSVEYFSDNSIPASDNIINLPTSKGEVHPAPKERSKVDEELMELIQRLTPEQKKLLLALIRGLLDSQ